MKTKAYTSSVSQIGCLSCLRFCLLLIDFRRIKTMTCEVSEYSQINLLAVKILQLKIVHQRVYFKHIYTLFLLVVFGYLYVSVLEGYFASVVS